jgi:hypothetical protein
MIARLFLLSCIFCSFSLNSPEEREETPIEALEAPEESLMKEEEDLSLLPKKGQRPQVVIIPTKASIQ